MSSWRDTGRPFSCNAFAVATLSSLRLQYCCTFVLGNATFVEFLRIVVEDFFWSGINRMNEHWRPQYAHCNPCDIEYDFIGRFEHLNDDAEYVLAKLTASGGPGSNVTFAARNIAGGTVSSSQQFRNLYANVSHKLMRKLIRIYKHDYELFGYDYHWACNDC